MELKKLMLSTSVVVLFAGFSNVFGHGELVPYEVYSQKADEFLLEIEKTPKEPSCSLNIQTLKNYLRNRVNAVDWEKESCYFNLKEAFAVACFNLDSNPNVRAGYYFPFKTQELMTSHLSEGCESLTREEFGCRMSAESKAFASAILEKLDTESQTYQN